MADSIKEKTLQETAHDCIDRAYAMGIEKGKAEADDMAASAVALFVAQCGEMAEKNWCEAQVSMLKWLMGAVLTGVEYAEYAMKDVTEEGGTI